MTLGRIICLLNIICINKIASLYNTSFNVYLWHFLHRPPVPMIHDDKNNNKCMLCSYNAILPFCTPTSAESMQMWDLCHNAHFIIPPNREVSVLPYSFCIGTMLVKPCNDKLSWKALNEINKELLQLFCREKKKYIWMNGLNFSESIPIYVFKQFDPELSLRLIAIRHCCSSQLQTEKSN